MFRAVFLLSLASSILGIEFWDPASDNPALNTFFSNDYIHLAFSQLRDAYPNLTAFTSLGETPNGNNIYAITITENVTHWRTHNRPNVKYVGNMHGNEVRGRGLLMKLAYFLNNRYAIDAEVKEFLQTTVFHLVPTINPDGFEDAAQHCSGITGRYTSEGVDMNRDFPDHWIEGTGSSKVKFAAETQMIMDYAETVPAVLGISFHDGALVANYPWDADPDLNSGQYATSPDDALFRVLAKSYSLNHATMADTNAQCSSDHFEDGITNGNQWYKVFNGMQDWNYFYNDCFELTIELGCCKYPTDASATYTDVWEDNINAVFAYTKQAQYGLRGRVTDYSGTPVLGTTITVSGVSKTIQVRQEAGYYWRPLSPGTYNITATKQGYFSYTVRNVGVLENNSTEVSFILIAKSQDSGSKGRTARDNYIWYTLYMIIIIMYNMCNI